MKLLNRYIITVLCLASFNVGASSVWEKKLEQADLAFERANYQSALKQYQFIAEETASMYAQFQVGWIYLNGLGVKKDCEEALRWFTYAATRGHQSAQNNLFVIYSGSCDGVAINDTRALHYLNLAAESGNSRAQANLAAELVRGNRAQKDPYRAFDLAHRSASGNDVYGMLELGTYYVLGTGVPKDARKGYAILEKASTMQVLDNDKIVQQEAQLMLGIGLLEGEGVPKDFEGAYRWLSLAASGPNAVAANQAKESLREIEPILQSEGKILSLQSDNKSYGVSVSQLTEKELEDILFQSIDDKKDSQTINIANNLAEKNNPIGQRVLGFIHLNGLGSILKDTDEAYILFKRACAQGDLISCVEQIKLLALDGRKENAESLLESIFREDEKNIHHKLAYADAFLATGNRVKAEILTREVLKSHPDDESAVLMLGKLLGR